MRIMSATHFAVARICACRSWSNDEALASVVTHLYQLVTENRFLTSFTKENS